MKETTLEVSGMTCGHCTMSVEKALKGSEGVTEASVDLKSGKAQVSFDEGKISAEQLAAAVTEAGYEAKVI
ncbi:MAG: copper ion binding protein [Spirochaetia bacterium]|nr:copper ion binding protein [Spirochaetia bacterium]